MSFFLEHIVLPKKDLRSAAIGDSAASKNLVQKILFLTKQNDGRLIPFMPSKVSGSAKEIQKNLTLSKKIMFS